MPDHLNIGRYQFIWWRRWAWIPYHKVTDAPIGYAYDRLGMIGPVEVRRLAPPPPVEVPSHA